MVDHSSDALDAAPSASGRASKDTPGILAARGILIDGFDRVNEQVRNVAAGLSADDGAWRPDAQANSISWLLWHLARVQDDHVADLAGLEQVWTSGSWFERFALPYDVEATGYSQTSADVGKVATPPAELAAYQSAVHELTINFVNGLSVAELARVVDTRWNPPVTCAVRLVSVINDCTDHVGQAEYVKGMLARR